MFEETTLRAIARLITTDAVATDAEKDAFCILLKGGPTSTRTLSVSDAAKRLGVARGTMYSYISNGWIKTTGNGKISEDSINNFVIRSK